MCKILSLPLNPLNVLPFCVIIVKYQTVIPTLVLMLLLRTVDFKQIKQEMENYNESIEKLTRTLINQFLELVENQIESIVPILRKTNLRVQSSPFRGCLVRDL